MSLNYRVGEGKLSVTKLGEGENLKRISRFEKILY